jgi:methylated-DNA-[protein]-cysteine S-methyltransferase
MIEVATLSTPIGPLALAAHEGAVCAVWFGPVESLERLLARWYPGEHTAPAVDPAGAASALSAYFAGDLQALAGIPVVLHGTPFQRRVWERLRDVPAGRTATYGAIAAAIGARSAVRAVGAANGANPVSIIVPCHRIIGANGALVGYGGGLDRKRWLLDHESRRLF